MPKANGCRPRVVVITTAAAAAEALPQGCGQGEDDRLTTAAAATITAAAAALCSSIQHVQLIQQLGGRRTRRRLGLAAAVEAACRTHTHTVQ